MCTVYKYIYICEESGSLSPCRLDRQRSRQSDRKEESHHFFLIALVHVSRMRIRRIAL